MRFFRLPAVVTNQGEQMISLTTERRRAWLQAISREDLTEEKLANVFVCGRHFVAGILIFQLKLSQHCCLALSLD